MAVDHVTIATDAGCMIRFWNILNDIIEGGSGYTADDLDTYRSEFEAVFDADARHKMLLTRGCAIIDAAWNAVQELKSAWLEQVFKPWCFLYLREASGLNSNAVTVKDMLGDLYDAMVADSKAVLENTVTLGTVTAGTNNTGNGTIFCYIKDVWGNTNESALDEKFLFTCISDRLNNGRTAGEEQFSWTGSINGAGPRLTCCRSNGSDANYGNRITNGDFEDWTGSAADSWTADTGAFGTQFNKEATNYYEGTYGLEIVGDDATASLQMSQANTVWYGYSATGKHLEPKGVYMLSAKIKTSGGLVTDTEVLTIQVAGTGISNDATTDIVITLDDTAPTSWTTYNRGFQLPKSINADTTLKIKITGTLTSHQHVYIDDLIVARMKEWPEAGLFAAAVPGSTDFIAGDKSPDEFTLTNTNDFASIWQSFFTRKTEPYDARSNTYPGYGIHLPSAAAAVTYTEALAQ